LPMLFYWTLQYHQNRHWKYPAYIFVMGFIATFLHPYLSALVLMWTAFYSVGYFIFTRSPLRSKLRHVIPYLGSVLLLFATTGTIIRLTDPLKDRPITPYGFLVYCTKISHIFASHYSLIWKIVERRYKFIINGSGDEGFTYLGFTVVIAVCASVLFFIIKTITSKRKPEEQNDTIADPQKFQSIWLFVAFAALLLSMGIPFVWNMEWLVDYLSFLRQFRSLGRFSWIFYYVITIYGVVVISRYYTYCIARNRKVMGYGLLIASMALWSYEATGYVTTERFSTMYSKEYFELFSGEKGHTWKKFFEDVHHKPDEYQGLLMLPYSHIGSDKLWLGGDMPGLQIPVALEIGLQLHIPMIDAMMARSSWGITMKQVKIEGGPFVYKPMLDDLPNDKPFLLMNLGYNELTADQKYLLSASDSIGLYDQWYVYALYPRRLKVNDKKNADSIRALAPYLHTGDTCLRNTGTWYVDHFDHGNAKETFFGTGAIPQINKTEMPLADIPVHPLYRNQQYEVSCWFLLNRKDYKNPNIKIDVFDSSDHLLSSTLAPTKESTDNNGLWFRLVHYIYLTPECARIRCTLMNADGNSYEIMDEFMLRPGDALIVSKSANGAIMANNHLLPK
ncbi:MAG: hypothetical protein JWQ38_1034, partial [Flavipsychrobacter sp.]|nr:hypothetical protein [Flavipsychrobacter sp.]